MFGDHGLLRGKTTLLVSNDGRQSILHDRDKADKSGTVRRYSTASHIVYLASGSQLQAGTFADLSTRPGPFRDFCQQHTTQSNEPLAQTSLALSKTASDVLDSTSSNTAPSSGELDGQRSTTLTCIKRYLTAARSRLLLSLYALLPTCALLFQLVFIPLFIRVGACHPSI